jgi:hypothetical protein
MKGIEKSEQAKAYSTRKGIEKSEQAKAYSTRKGIEKSEQAKAYSTGSCGFEKPQAQREQAKAYSTKKNVCEQHKHTSFSPESNGLGVTFLLAGLLTLRFVATFPCYSAQWRMIFAFLQQNPTNFQLIFQLNFHWQGLQLRGQLRFCTLFPFK